MKKPKLFISKIDRMKSDILVDPKYREIVRGKIEARSGVYALYKKNGKLYYIGRSNRMKDRLKAHIRDRHRGKWERFSVYFTKNNTRGREYTDSIEDALISIAGKPEGNSQSSLKVKSLNREIWRDMNKINSKRTKDIAGIKRNKKESKKNRVPSIQNPFGKNKPLVAMYKNKEYKAIWLKSGYIRYKNIEYSSPSAAEKKVRGCKGGMNGPKFWLIEGKFPIKDFL